MNGPENNPRDDEPIDREEYEKWEAQQKGEKMPTFEGPTLAFEKTGQIAVNAPGCDKCGKVFLDCKCSAERTAIDDTKIISLSRLREALAEAIAAYKDILEEKNGWCSDTGLKSSEHAAVAKWEEALQSVPSSPRALTEHQKAVEDAAGMGIDWGMANGYEIGEAQTPNDAPHQIADVTIDAPKGIPGWIKVEPSDAPQDAFEGLKATPSAFAVPSSERVGRLEQDAVAPSDVPPAPQPRTCQEGQD